ncbi:MAG: M28 family peptidase [Bryobacteraceae bacterium]
MKKLLLFGVAASLFAQMTEISGTRMRANVKFLSSDLLEGRGVGTRGGRLASAYLAAQLELAGVKPAGDNGTYFQDVPMVGVETRPHAEITAQAGGQTLKLHWLNDFVGVSERQRTESDFDAPAIFVGHGISAPEYNWDDYKGVDVRGKVLVMFTNEPPSDDPKFFGGRALTYYGRWTYKYEEALRRGAVAAILIHTTPTAGYGWDVVSSSWGKEDPEMKLAAGETGLAFAGWVTEAAGEKLAGMAGHTVGDLLKRANSRDFLPIPLGFNIRGHIPSKIRAIDSRNVIGEIPGSDAQLKSEAVIFSAHWDHLGIGKPVNGDAIYNGAVDNGTGCAIVLEIARAWSRLPLKPRRSALFIFVTAEEAGLRGSEYYARHPAIPESKTALALNFDAFYPFGRTRDVGVNGAERTTAWPVVEEAARRMDLEIKPDPRPEQGTYFRSDHFSFARAGIPAFSIDGGNDFFGKPAGYGDKVFEEFNSKHYHQPSDEYHDDWDFAGMEQMARFGFLINEMVANRDALPQWNSGDEFHRGQ